MSIKDKKCKICDRSVNEGGKIVLGNGICTTCMLKKPCPCCGQINIHRICCELKPGEVSPENKELFDKADKLMREIQRDIRTLINDPWEDQ